MKKAPALKTIYQITLWLADMGNGVCVCALCESGCVCVSLCVCIYECVSAQVLPV